MKQKQIWLAVSELMRRAETPRLALALDLRLHGNSSRRDMPCPWPRHPDAVAHMGDQVAVVLSSARAGYVSLFNLGTGGTCRRLIPGKGQSFQCIHQTPLHLPAPGQPQWCLRGPTTQATGGLEILFAVRTSIPHEGDFFALTSAFLREKIDFDYGITCIEVLGRAPSYAGHLT